MNTKSPDLTTEQAGTQAAPAPSGSDVVRSTADTSGLTFGSALLMCVFTALITIMVVFYAPSVAKRFGVTLPQSATGVGSMVYLDIEKVLEAGMRRSLSQVGGVRDVQAQADKFQADMSVAIHAYADAGITVVNSKALIQGSSVHDVTDEVLARLGLGR